MKRIFAKLIITTCFVLFLPSLSAKPLTEGDRIVFFGDSITEYGMHPNGYVTLVNKAIQAAYPKKYIDVVGSGADGNTILDLQRRVNDDVLQQIPSIVVIFTGVNDIWLNGNTIPRKQFSRNLQQLVLKIRKRGVQTMLVTPAVRGERAVGQNRFDVEMEEYAAITRQIGKATRSPVVDLRQAFVDYLEKYNGRNQHQGVLTIDSVHLNWRGNQLAAATMLEALQVPANGALFKGINGEFRHRLKKFVIRR